MNQKTIRRSTALAAGVVLLCAGADWAQFRGPNASGLSRETGIPSTWSAEENVAWKTALPGFGASSPITVGDKIFLTCYSGYGLSKDEPGDQADLRQNVVALDGARGEILWSQGVKPRLPQTEYRGFIALHGYASSTPASDGSAVYAFFGSSGVAAFGVDGKPLWRADVGSKTHEWGSAASPILYNNLLIVNASIESQSIVALNKSSGKEVWRTPGIEQSWGTPVIVDVPGGQKELVVSIKNKILGLDPATGRELWQCAGVKDYVCPSLIAHQGVVYVTGARKATTMAVRAGGRGDVTATRVLWEAKVGSLVPTPLYYEGRLYWIDAAGVATCLDAATGEQVYRERLEIAGGGNKIYSSLVYADGKFFCATREKGTIVLAAKPQFEELARNDLGDSSVFNATPVPSRHGPDGRGQLLLRSDRFLYSIGK